MKRNSIAIIVAGGGTGGHLFPAISVINELEKRVKQSRVLFILGSRARGAELISGYGYEVGTVDVEGMKGRGWRKTASVFFRLPKSVFQSMGHIRRFAPDVVFGVGGYSAGPVCIAAKLKGVPCAIHEQNTIPGFTNRMLARFATQVFVSFEETKDLLGRPEAIVTGTPIRPQIQKASTKSKPSKGDFTILVVGGSQGALAINKALTQALELLDKRGRSPVVIHQSGKAHYESTLNEYKTKGLKGEVLPFIEDMADAYLRADLVVCRAGASTVFELAAMGKPAILIPYPFAANLHQDRNAQALADTGGAVVVFERDLNGEVLADHIQRIMDNTDLLHKMASAAKGLAKPRAAELIAENLIQLVGR